MKMYMPLNRCFTASSSVAFVVFTPLSVLRLLFSKRFSKPQQRESRMKQLPCVNLFLSSVLRKAQAVLMHFQ